MKNLQIGIMNCTHSEFKYYKKWFAKLYNNDKFMEDSKNKLCYMKKHAINSLSHTYVCKGAVNENNHFEGIGKTGRCISINRITLSE